MVKVLPTIATLGGHSALEIMMGAKRQGFRTLAIIQKGREKTYTIYFKNLIDDVVIVDSFKQLTDRHIIKLLQKKNCLFIPHRYCQVYCDLKKLESLFPIPIFGNKYFLKYEERSGPFNQYQIIKEAGVNYPKQFNDPKNIDTLVIVKVKEAQRGYERAFFFANNYQEYKKKARKLIDDGKIKLNDLEDAVIEEYLIGAQLNFNFFYSVVKKRLELLGTDIRRQTNIDGIVRIPTNQARELENIINPSFIEVGHIAVTVKESLLENAFLQAEKILKAAKQINNKGLVGPFALQTAILSGPPKEKIVIFDLSLRIPGSPGTSFTPYSKYLYGNSITFGERIALEIKEAFTYNYLSKICS